VGNTAFDDCRIIMTQGAIEFNEPFAADRQGEIAERGRQDDLLAKDGIFRKMWEMQRQTLVVEEEI